MNATRDIYARASTVVVYVGAANGSHIPFLADLFPEIECFYLFDGAPFDRTVERHPRIKTFTGQAGFVTDATIKTFLRLAQGRDILYVSDIRTVPSEVKVRDDMISQARWGIEMGAKAMLLKFRPPYAVGKTKHASVETGAERDFFMNSSNSSNSQIIDVDESIPVDRRMLYLHGRVQPQLFAPMNSTEARLYVRPINGSYKLTYYDVKLHEEHSYFYNLSTRRLYLVSFDPPLDAYLPGFDLGWESIQAYKIAEVHARANGRDWKGAVRTLADMLSKLSLNRELKSCLSETLEKYEKKNGNRREFETRRLGIWRRLIDVQEKEMEELQRRRIRDRAVQDGVFSTEEVDVLLFAFRRNS